MQPVVRQPVAIGRDAVRKAQDMSSRTQINVEVQTSRSCAEAPTWAYVRTNSAGTRPIWRPAKTTSEAQELVIFKKGTMMVLGEDRSIQILPPKPPAK